MAGLENHQGVLHTIKAWLYPNYLQNVEGKYIARIKTDKVLSVADVCAAATTRGGSDINYDTMVEAVETYFDECVYQLADGFSVENRYYALHTKVGGTFEHADSPVDPQRNEVDVTMRKRSLLIEILRRISINILGLAESEAYIAEVQDVTTGTTGEILTPSGAFKVLGRHIKIAGPDASCGLYLAPASGAAAVKVTGNLITNNPAELIALVPALAPGEYHVRVVTQYSNSSTLLKAPRTIEYAAPMTVPAPAP